MRQRIDALRYVAWCGRHSGIPRCCVVWYLLRNHLVRWYRSRIYRWWWTRRDYAKTPGYIRCPASALLRRRVDVLYCDEDCILHGGHVICEPTPRSVLRARARVAA